MTNRLFCGRIPLVKFGGVAHLGERSVRNAEVEGSIPFVSIMQKDTAQVSFCVILALWRGIEAALRKRSGGAFLAVTEDFCKARENKSVQIALQKSRRSPSSRSRGGSSRTPTPIIAEADIRRFTAVRRCQNSADRYSVMIFPSISYRSSSRITVPSVIYIIFS